jgi:hypothetical protein
MVDIKTVPERMIDAAARIFAASLMATGSGLEAGDRRKIAEQDTEAFFAKLVEMSR